VDFHLNFGEVLTIAFTAIGAIWALMKMIARHQEQALQVQFRSFNEQLREMTDEVKQDRDATQRIERDLFALRAELPRDYVRRDDFVRVIGEVNTKIDNMALRVERAILQNRVGSTNDN
jgi:hypothetical protein